MATKKKITKKPAKALPQPERLKVRMYRQGLGDCFLLTLPTGGARPFYMLIDCGVILGTKDPEERMTKVLNDITAVTKGTIDLLVVTHEHWDHISGFVQVPELFNAIDFKQMWLAWTEDPKDALANKLRAERRVSEQALRMALNRMALGGGDSSHVDSLLSFFGARGGSTADAMAKVNQRAKNGPRYCRPGEPPIHLPEVPGLRFWVLGPPDNEKLIKKSNPGKGEAYGLDAGGSQAMLVAAFTRGMGVGAPMPLDETLLDPFDAADSIPMSRARQLPFFQAHYFGEATDEGVFPLKAGPALRDQSWRRIDLAWTDGAEAMALQLDSATNNTSLVIAMEIIDTGEVLLFPGDAQAGNWLSWQDLKWENEKVTGPDLLARTIFYKVGHHGSHNATLQAKGLEQMVSDKLVAMIPVDQEMAKKKGWGKIPLKDLMDRLAVKTRGRMLRIDDPATTAADLVKAHTTPEWQAFSQRVTVTELFYELSF